MKKINLGLLFLSAAAGCGSNGTGDVDTFLASMAQQQCAWEFRCCSDPEIKQLDGRKFTNMDDCVGYRLLALENQLYLDRLAAREGRLRVDATQATACLGQMNDRQCNPKPGMPNPITDPMAMDACVTVFVGSTPVGNECIYTDECEPGAHCVGDTTVVGRGVCVPFQEETQICNATTDCDPKVKNLYCAQQDFHCHTLARLFEACAYTTDSNGKNPTLPLLLECDNSLGNVYCDPVSSTCKQLPSDGEPCLSPPPPGVSSSCDPDPALQLVCDTSGGGTSGVCRAPAKLNESCATRSCGTNLYCDSTTGSPVCRSVPTLNQQCQASGFRCQTPYFCNSQKSPAVCDQPAGLGQDCSQVQCDTTLYCDTSLFTCAARKPDGATCTSSNQCISLVCSLTAGQTQDTCQPHTTTITVQCSGRN